MKVKKITIDDLALMVQNGFVENRKYIDKRFDAVDECLDRIEDRLNNLEEGLREMKEDLSYIKVELNKRVDIFIHKDLELRVEKLEEKLKKYEKLLAQKT
jgi:uncharacterized protein YPO0396